MNTNDFLDNLINLNDNNVIINNNLNRLSDAIICDSSELDLYAIHLLNIRARRFLRGRHLDIKRLELFEKKLLKHN